MQNATPSPLLDVRDLPDNNQSSDDESEVNESHSDADEVELELDELLFATRSELRLIKSQVIGFIDAADAYVRASMHQRVADDLAVHITSLNNLAIDLKRMETRIPPPTFWQLCVRLRNTLKTLEVLQEDAANLVAGAPAPPARQWEILPRGGCKLVLNRAVLQELCEVGMADWEIAQFMRCCRKTVVRRRKEWGIEKRNWHDISLEDLVLVSSSSANLNESH